MPAKVGSEVRAAVFLDRDGVLNDAVIVDGVVGSPRTIEELRIDAEARPALDALRAAGFLLLVVTNQPDIGRGTMAREDLDALHARLQEALPVDGIYTCCHDTSDGCDCRKPLPGLILRAADEYGVDLADSWMVGDRWIDLEAAMAAGVAGVLLERPWSWSPTSHGQPRKRPHMRYSAATLTECASFIMSRSRTRAKKEPA